ncbi:MAG: hypothetical protein AAFY71_25510 [Bacteroidota bacterium]
MGVASVICQLPVLGQEKSHKGQWSAQINLSHQDLVVSQPFFIGQLGVAHQVRVRPEISSDIMYILRNDKKISFLASGSVGYYHNLYQEAWFSYQLGIGLRAKFGKKLFMDLQFQNGNAHVRYSDVQYVLEDGIWVKANSDKPKFRGRLTTIKLNLGYTLREGSHPISLMGSGKISLLGDPDFGPIPYYGYGIGLRYGL